MTEQKPRKDAVAGVGPNLAAAIAAAATRIGLHEAEVDHRIDLQHFRSADGRSIGVDSVKVWVWPKEKGLVQASQDARTWIETLLSEMGFGGSVETRVSDGEVVGRIRTDQAARLVGRAGATLDAVRTLLEATLGSAHPGFRFRLDVVDERERRDRDEPRSGRGRSDRREGDRRRQDDPERRGRSMGGRGRSDRREGDRRRQDDPERHGHSMGGEETLDRTRKQKEIEHLAHKLARKVLESGDAELIRKELNSFERRIVHVAVATYEGLGTESVGEGSYKQVRILRKPTATPEGTDA
ncbi:MAG: hypothetical protein JXB39_13790 [Deltaproteobacteria bacterium]|nr:hypothetical protein [Deltaproteobacteria bacterium]